MDGIVVLTFNVVPSENGEDVVVVAVGPKERFNGVLAFTLVPSENPKKL